MTQHTEQINRMIQEAADEAIRIAARLEKSGGIDSESPWYCKVVVCSALRDAASGYVPLCAEGKAELKNLGHF